MSKRFTFVLAMVFVLAVSALAFGQGTPGIGQYDSYHAEGYLLPTNASPTTVWKKGSNGSYSETTLAFAYNSGGANGHCNRECWDFTIENHVSVAQWLDWSIDGTRKDWRVMKPGIFASDSVTARVASNNDVEISFWAEDPSYQNPEAESPDIAKWFGYSVGSQASDISDVVEWVRGSDFTAEEPLKIRLGFDQVSGEGAAFRIFEQIEVTNEHRSSEYFGEGFVLICLTNLKHWVDAETGAYAGDGNGNGGEPTTG